MPPDLRRRGAGTVCPFDTPPILSMAPLLASLAIFDEAGLEALRARSLRLTDYLLFLIDAHGSRRIEVITPREPARRGCQISLRVHRAPRDLMTALASAGVVCDLREPDIIRVSTAPLYNRFHEVWRFAHILARDAG